MYLPLVTVGPVVGTVTKSTAIVLLEVDEAAELTFEFVPEEGSTVTVSKEFERFRATTVTATGLQSGMRYHIRVGGLAEGQWTDKVCTFKTTPQQVSNVKFVALSCNRFTRLLEGEENPWGRVHRYVQDNDVNAILHLGDQVYTTANGYLERAVIAMENFDKHDKYSQKKMKKRALDQLRESYRETWNQPHCEPTLAAVANHMIWSDNDVANDFTTMKDANGRQAYTPDFLQCAMKVYREYQAQLYNPKCKGFLPRKDDPIDELQFHRYGPCGVLMLDMRGNRITSEGVQKWDTIMSDRQWSAVRKAFETTGLSLMIVGAEIPFVGDSPADIKKKAEKVDFLRDHWPYSEEELTQLLVLCFDWKNAAPGREVVMLGGDIHVGVNSVIYDDLTGLEIKQITTSSITNHVCPFFPPLEGRVNERFHYVHSPVPDERNYCTIDADFDPETQEVTRCDVVLETVPTLKTQKKAAEVVEGDDRHPGLKDKPDTVLGSFVTKELQGELRIHIRWAKGLFHFDEMTELQSTLRLSVPRVGHFELGPFAGTDYQIDEKVAFDNITTENKFMVLEAYDVEEQCSIGRATLPLKPFSDGWSSFDGEVFLHNQDFRGRRSAGMVSLRVRVKQ
ncbi:MAG: hypothetical protein KVP17_003430 [Porospora cf. gigantea B]|uniref:uncharacterized protein n=1 Tax=Porospora cf. gigantea B TaxID=2853592 RepID=UPI003571AACE|nr:MAG: hypothetical protein KVP17_003430 [Porospora cf. gigantea B]